jgi:hypothetical protein
MAQLGETVRAAYQIMVDMTMVVTFVPFFYIFSAGVKFANRFAVLSGLAVTLLATVFAIMPPPEIRTTFTFELKVLGGTALFGLLGFAIFDTCGRGRNVGPGRYGSEQTVANRP